MALPMNVAPVYTLTIPSTGKEFKYRPFLVKDEKALLIAQQSEDDVVILDTIKQVVKSCAISSIDMETLASFDIEYIFLKLRAISIGEVVDLYFRCDVDHGEDNEKAVSLVKVDLTKVEVNKDEPNNPKINLFNDVGVMMKYPTFDTLKKMEESNSDELDIIFGIVSDCIDYIYTAEEMYPSKDQKKEELIEFLNNLTSEQFGKIQEFFKTMPVLRANVEYKCPVCGREHKKYLEGLQSFF